MPRQMLFTTTQPPVSGSGGPQKQAPQANTSLSVPNTEVNGRRLVALALDWMVVSFLQSILTFGVRSAGVSVPSGRGQYFLFTITHQLNWPWVFVLFFAYYFLFEVLFGATPGKLLLGLRVVTLSGKHPTIWQLFVRSAVRLLEVAPGISSGVWMVSGLCVWFTSRHQRIGDLLGGTIVADAASLPSAASTRLQRIRRAAFSLAIVELLAILCLAFSFYVQPYQYTRDWQNGQHLNFLPNSAIVSSTSSPTYGQNAQGERTITYTLYFSSPQNRYEYETGYEIGDGIHQYRLSITYRWSNPLVGWEIDSDSIRVESVN